MPPSLPVRPASRLISASYHSTTRRFSSRAAPAVSSNDIRDECLLSLSVNPGGGGGKPKSRPNPSKAFKSGPGGGGTPKHFKPRPNGINHHGNSERAAPLHGATREFLDSGDLTPLKELSRPEWSTLHPGDLSMLLFSLGKKVKSRDSGGSSLLREFPLENWISRAGELAEAEDGFTGTHLARCCLAVARIQSQERVLQDIAVLLFQASRRKLEGQVRDDLPRGHRFNSQGLSNLVYSVGQLLPVLEVQDVSGFLDTWFRAAQRITPIFEPQDLSNSMYALGKYFSVGPDPGFLRAWLRRMGDSRLLSKFTDQDLSLSMYGLGLVLSQSDSGTAARQEELLGFLRLWLTECSTKRADTEDEARLSSFSSQHLTNSLYGLSKLLGPMFLEESELVSSIEAPLPLRRFLRAWERAALTGNMNRFSSQGLVNSLWALTSLTEVLEVLENRAETGTEGSRARERRPFPSPLFLVRWERAAVGKLDSFSTQGVVTSLACLATLKRRQTLSAAVATTTFNRFQRRDSDPDFFLEVAERIKGGTLDIGGPEQICNVLYTLAGRLEGMSESP